jgi:hypothetical protein
VRAYDGRYQIEVNIDEVKELGLAHYQGRSAQGIRRWPLVLSLGQMILKFIAIWGWQCHCLSCIGPGIRARRPSAK